ncbi:fumarylacetoacetate hydrolase family protein [Geomicrobium sp. JCM 19039]|uniref:fumarylacetoacetate hydrolase family protein n=1 Tax=Geomicrobium sp. JCM 19039 TaxID=1460636 RepID=UPI00045F4047|nr:fumarylacetoacetate hydrolase family protein [Geomicrobium sp. JCM 19039]GAK11796.1 fumarylacetoacetate hydrolase family protein [Geomicrobium sp. JCM 19039]
MKYAMVSYKGERELVVQATNENRLLRLKAAFQQFAPEVECPNNLIQFIHKSETLTVLTADVLRQANETLDADFWINEEFEWLAPIQSPPKNILCVGKNYAAHAIEMGSAKDIPEHPLIFTKSENTINAHKQPVPLHEQVTDQVDYEGEVAVIIGKKAHAIQKEEAWDYVFGFTLLNDITARDLQARHKQFYLGKSLDGFCPMGPAVLLSSERETLLQDTIVTKVNGEIRQQAPLTDMIFDIPELLHVISKGMTLLPGDIIATGTPSGVGKGMTPPKFLGEGDHVSVHLPSIGTLENTMIR